MSDSRSSVLGKLGAGWITEGAAVYGGWSALEIGASLTVSAEALSATGFAAFTLGVATVSGALALAAVPALLIGTVAAVIADEKHLNELSEAADLVSYSSLGTLTLVPFSPLFSPSNDLMTGAKAFGPILDLGAGIGGLFTATTPIRDAAVLAAGTGASYPSWQGDINKELNFLYPGWTSPDHSSSSSSGSPAVGGAPPTNTGTPHPQPTPGSQDSLPIGGGDLLPYSPGTGDFEFSGQDSNSTSYSEDTLTFTIQLNLSGSNYGSPADVDSENNSSDQTVPPPNTTPEAPEPSEPAPTEPNPTPPDDNPGNDNPGDDEPDDGGED